MFWLNDRQLMVADADTARRAHADNFADLTMPDRFIDTIRGRHSTPVSWKQVRSLWLAQMRTLSGPGPADALANRMDALLRYRVGTPVDFVWAGARGDLPFAAARHYRRATRSRPGIGGP